MVSKMKDVREKETNITTLSGGEGAKQGRHGIDLTEPNTAKKNKSNVFCCCFTEQESKNKSNPMDSNHEQQPGNNIGCCMELKGFFHSIPYYVFVLFTTLVVVSLLLCELFIDLFSEKVEAESEDKYIKSISSVGSALHYFSLAILALFFIEVLMRLMIWRRLIVQNCITLIDCIITTTAFLNILFFSIIMSPSGVYDSCALIIVFRFVHVYSVARLCKNNRPGSYAEVEKQQIEMVSTQAEVQRLYRQIADKDFEIKQLHAHLSSGHSIEAQEVAKVWLEAKKKASVSAAAAPKPDDEELNKAIELSKKEYENETNAFSNATFIPSMDKSDVETDDGYCSVIVHHTRNSFKRTDADFDDIGQNFLFTNENNSNSVLVHGANETNHKKNLSLIGDSSLLSSSVSNLFGNEAQSDSGPHSPINVYIDPSILNCSDAPASNTNKQSFDFQKDFLNMQNGQESSFMGQERLQISNNIKFPSPTGTLTDSGYQSEDVNTMKSISSSSQSITM